MPNNENEPDVLSLIRKSVCEQTYPIDGHINSQRPVNNFDKLIVEGMTNAPSGTSSSNLVFGKLVNELPLPLLNEGDLGIAVPLSPDQRLVGRTNDDLVETCFSEDGFKLLVKEIGKHLGQQLIERDKKLDDLEKLIWAVDAHPKKLTTDYSSREYEFLLHHCSQAVIQVAAKVK